MGRKKPPNANRHTKAVEIDARDAWQQAESFRDAAVRWGQILGDEEKFELIAPITVNAAFALELYFKCFHAVLKESVPRGHSLRYFYMALPALEREAITNYYQASINASRSVADARNNIPSLDVNLATVLVEIDKVFERWRYTYEKGGRLPSTLGIDQLTFALRQRILEYKPDWAERA